MRNLPFTLLCITFTVATIAFFQHAVDLNPQYDTQGERYGSELVTEAHKGKMWKYITELPPRKYPMLYVIPFSLAFQSILTVGDTNAVSLLQMHIASRTVTLLYSIGTILLLVLVARRLQLRASHAVILLFSSVLFFLFETAVRPHGAVTFWTLLTYFLSLRLIDRPSIPRTLLAFAAAACSFATLQSGIFAFIFPVWAVLIDSRDWKRLLQAGGLLGVFGLTSALIGYPFLLRGILRMESGQIDTSLGHDMGFNILPTLIPSKLWMLLSAEIILCGFAVWGIVMLIKGNKQDRRFYIPMFAYLIAFISVFAMQPITSSRFFLPTFPLLALIGAYTYERLPRAAQTGLPLFLIAVYVQFTLLGFHKNTLQEASAYVINDPGQVTSGLPNYFYNIPAERFIETREELPNATRVILTKTQPVKNFFPCATFLSSKTAAAFAENESPFLWNAVSWPLYFVFTTRAIGPNLTVYCREPIL